LESTVIVFNFIKKDNYYVVHWSQATSAETIAENQ